VVEHGVLPINFACPNIIRVGKDGAEGCSDVISPWSAAVGPYRPLVQPPLFAFS
jgi:gamma-glutamyltranspeptidase/glutathione hydrolase